MFRATELTKLRLAAERIMSSTLAAVSIARAPDGEGGWVDTPTRGTASKCRLTPLKDDPRILTEQPDNKTRSLAYCPWNFIAKQGDDLEIDGAVYHVEKIRQATSAEAIQTAYEVWL